MILMQQGNRTLDDISYIIGSKHNIFDMVNAPVKECFDDCIISYLSYVSKLIMNNPQAKTFSEVITFGFWIRKGNLLSIKKRFGDSEEFRIGRGVAFHIAPSNVPVIFAYSLVAGLLTGNRNIVRLPSKSFPQVDLIVNAFLEALEVYDELKNSIVCVQYERNKEINDWFSSFADLRIVWGGDNTISEIRKSPLRPRAKEVTFADRYSIAVIDSDFYIKTENKKQIAEDFYNDTFLSDQNACTSPRMVIWIGNLIDEAKQIFWEEEHYLVEKRYSLQAVQSVNKLTSSYLASAIENGVRIMEHKDNLIIRIQLQSINNSITKYFDNSGLFYEFDCKNIQSITALIDDTRCQTVAYIGDSSLIVSLVKSGIKGVDRVVPVGKTMDFDLIWDGYDLVSEFSRLVTIK